MSLDVNDKLMAGNLPFDPTQDAVVVANDFPRIKTVVELLRGGQERALSRADTRGLTTGNWYIDDATGGLMPGFVWVFGASSSWGKSSFLISMTDENIKQGKKVLIVSAEDDEKIYGDRLLIRRSKVSADNFRKRRLTNEEKHRIADVVQKGEDMPVFFDARGKSIEWVTAKVKQLIKEYGIDAVAFDYLQAFDGDKRQQDRRMQINYIDRMMTDTIKGAGVTGIIFSQITMPDGRPHPDKSSIRESQDVANAAEVVMLGFTPDGDVEVGGKVVAYENKKCVLLDKNKMGQRGGFYAMDWNDESACFETVVSQETKKYQQITGGEFDTFGDGDSF